MSPSITRLYRILRENIEKDLQNGSLPFRKAFFELKKLML